MCVVHTWSSQKKSQTHVYFTFRDQLSRSDDCTLIFEVEHHSRHCKRRSVIRDWHSPLRILQYHLLGGKKKMGRWWSDVRLSSAEGHIDARATELESSYVENYFITQITPCFRSLRGQYNEKWLLTRPQHLQNTIFVSCWTSCIRRLIDRNTRSEKPSIWMIFHTTSVDSIWRRKNGCVWKTSFAFLIVTCGGNG